MDFGTFDGFWQRLVERRLHAQEERSVETILLQLLPMWRSCAICHLLWERVFDLTSRWQYELSRETDGRARFIENETWCNRHAWFFEKMAGPRTVGRLQRGLLSRLESRISERLAGDASDVAGQSVTRILRDLAGERRCPMCEDEDAFQEVLLAEVIRGLTSGSLRPAFAVSGGGCLPHLAVLLHRAPDQDTARWLLRTALDQLRRLTQELDTYEVETLNRTRRYGSTADAPLRAMIRWAGLRGMVHESEARVRVPAPCGGME